MSLFVFLWLWLSRAHPTASNAPLLTSAPNAPLVSVFPAALASHVSTITALSAPLPPTSASSAFPVSESQLQLASSVTMLTVLNALSLQVYALNVNLDTSWKELLNVIHALLHIVPGAPQMSEFVMNVSQDSG